MYYAIGLEKVHKLLYLRMWYLKMTHKRPPLGALVFLKNQSPCLCKQANVTI